MVDDVITTGVDDLLLLLRGVNKISLTEAAERLGVNPSLVQAWVDFLVEEEIIGIEYKFTKPLIYLNKEPEKATVTVDERESFNLDFFKQEFWKRANERKIPENKISFFWKNHINDVVNGQKDLFYREARKRKLNNIDSLWEDFLKGMLSG